jgi:hypothetical protein
MDCYHYKKQIYTNGILNESVDATYILHLEGNGRIDNIHKQLAEYQPTNSIYILFNKGYKKCKKDKGINQPAVDLVDAYLHIFNHAKQSNYNNILILEDDFIFNEKIKEPTNTITINTFLNKHKDTNFIYYLGCIPFLQVPFDYYHNITILAGGSHAVIYSKKYREQILDIDQTTILDWDVLLMTSTFLNRYCYYTPLCYQLFPETDNSKLWGIGINETFSKIFVFIMHTIIQTLKIDVQTEPGYSFLYAFSKIMFYILIILVLLILYRAQSIYKYKSYKTKI